MKSWKYYYELLKELEEKSFIELQSINDESQYNAHMFYIKTKDLEERNSLISYLKNRNIMSVFHYIPLHSSHAGKKFAFFNGQDIYTTKESERLIRLPLYYNLSEEDILKVTKSIKEFFYS